MPGAGSPAGQGLGHARATCASCLHTASEAQYALRCLHAPRGRLVQTLGICLAYTAAGCPSLVAELRQPGSVRRTAAGASHSLPARRTGRGWSVWGPEQGGAVTRHTRRRHPVQHRLPPAPHLRVTACAAAAPSSRSAPASCQAQALLLLGRRRTASVQGSAQLIAKFWSVTRDRPGLAGLLMLGFGASAGRGPSTAFLHVRHMPQADHSGTSQPLHCQHDTPGPALQCLLERRPLRGQARARERGHQRPRARLPAREAIQAGHPGVHGAEVGRGRKAPPRDARVRQPHSDGGRARRAGLRLRLGSRGRDCRPGLALVLLSSCVACLLTPLCALATVPGQLAGAELDGAKYKPSSLRSRQLCAAPA